MSGRGFSTLSTSPALARVDRPQETMACPPSLHYQTQLARVVRGRLARGRPLEIVEVGVEPADQLIQLEGGFPNIEKQVAPRATAPDAALPVDGGIISLVPGATAFELSGSDLQGGQVFSTFLSVSPFNAVLKLRMPSPSPLATSGIFFPPNNSVATARITNNSGQPMDSNIPYLTIPQTLPV